MNAMTLAKKALSTVLHRFGLDLVHSLGEGHLLRQAVHIMKERHVAVVFDVGANSGQWARTIRSLGYRGNIVSYEPLSDAYRALHAQARRDGSWTAINVALGEYPQSAVIHVAGNSQSSSMLEMLPVHREASPQSVYVRDETVRMETLAMAVTAHAPGNDPIFVKIDAQGYEGRVLKGAAQAVGRVAAMQVELSLVSLYDGEPLIEEMIAYMRDLGFVPSSFEPNFWSKDGGRVLQVDGLFIRD